MGNKFIRVVNALMTSYNVQEYEKNDDRTAALISAASLGIDEGLSYGEKYLNNLMTQFGLKSNKIIPALGGFASILSGIYFCAERIKNGEYISGILEITSGIVGAIPVFGTTCSFAIDAFLFLKDLFF